MQLNCPKCGNNAFKIVTDEEGKPVAECAKCGAVTLFDRSAMKEAPKSKDSRSAQRPTANKLEPQS
jgi:uncharacterized Zn finger protein